ncbi:hypothetical protein B0H15DRAFT_958565 [Mycena belliarum]|uniref:Uncharacterized protein n=1 Tax=Mycena belliarum TaxID=1033014 RepID=A0AAD6TMA2_9AGAR|nr:hypothetical protein B0H15DRAFT_958565 [Mycena belliae]
MPVLFFRTFPTTRTNIASKRRPTADLDLRATLASAAVSLPASAVLEYQGDFAGSLPQATESFSGYHDDNNDSYRYVHNTQSSDYFRDDYVQDDTAAYMPIFSLNSQEWPPSPPPKLTGSKRPSSPTPLLGTSPKRAHISTGYDSLSWSSSPIPTLSTAQNMTSEGDQPLGHTPRPAPLAPAAHLAPLLQNVPPAPVLIEAKPDLVVTKGNWTPHELSVFYEFCLGQDADSIFKKITLSSNKCWKSFIGKIALQRDSKQMRTQWDASPLAFYKKLVPLLKFTGGGADADEEPDWEDKDAVSAFLKTQQSVGNDVEGLSAKKVKQWQTSGWYALFDARYGKNPKAVREVPRSSADDLSDLEGGAPPEDDNDSDIEFLDKPTYSSVPATPAPSATKPAPKGLANDPREIKSSTWDRSKPASCGPSVKVKKEDRLQGLNSYLEGRMRVDEQQMKLAKADAEFKRLKASETTAKEIIGDTMGIYSEETKAKARRVLDKLMDVALNF